MAWQAENLGILFDSRVPRAQLSLGSTVLAVGGKQLQARSPGSWPWGRRHKMSRTVHAHLCVMPPDSAVHSDTAIVSRKPQKSGY